MGKTIIPPFSSSWTPSPTIIIIVIIIITLDQCRIKQCSWIYYNNLFISFTSCHLLFGSESFIISKQRNNSNEFISLIPFLYIQGYSKPCKTPSTIMLIGSYLTSTSGIAVTDRVDSHKQPYYHISSNIATHKSLQLIVTAVKPIVSIVQLRSLLESGVWSNIPNSISHFWGNNFQQYCGGFLQLVAPASLFHRKPRRTAGTPSKSHHYVPWYRLLPVDITFVCV